ncbi:MULTISPECIES: hypothetical protein [Bacillus subtilis group]|uniref:hypothetical protein n=1 Tax=Bacillus TaxID=1386 RepID=UPI0011A4E70D|nr:MULTISPECIES: hypothetical protein [Bacillus subtilis group]MBT3123385.1 hypothetical protein [Bacillus inaquosorum]MCF7615467.1 hypothetical protein [Bacillus subtilis]QWK35384.1 hypothetical protein KM843_19690 [Bacillus velezensis]
MQLFKIWSKKNRRDNGSSRDRGVEDIVDEKEEDGGMQIHVGAGGLLDSTRTDKETYYRDIKNSMTQDTINRIRDIAVKSKNKNDLFSKMEDAGIPLKYLIALDPASYEVDVQSYRTLKEKGIDVTKVLSNKEILDFDESYAREIISMKDPVPELKRAVSVDDNSVDDIENINYEDIQEDVEREEEITNLQKGGTELDHVDHKDNQEMSEVEDSLSGGIEGVSDDTEAVNVGDLDDSVDQKGEGEENGEPLWKNYLESLKNDIGNSNGEDDNDIEVIEDAGIKNRQVFILSNKITEVDDMDGYEFTIIENIQQVNLYTTHKDNLLVITQNIPETLQRPFFSWLTGVIDEGERYRIVTLNSSPVSHKLIEDRIDLTKESLDEYYDRRNSDDYIGDGAGEFFDISKVLNGGTYDE